MAFLVRNQKDSLLGPCALDLVVLDDELLLEHLDGVKLFSGLGLCQHDLTEVALTQHSKEVEVVEANLLRALMLLGLLRQRLLRMGSSSRVRKGGGWWRSRWRGRRRRRRGYLRDGWRSRRLVHARLGSVRVLLLSIGILLRLSIWIMLRLSIWVLLRRSVRILWLRSVRILWFCSVCILGPHWLVRGIGRLRSWRWTDLRGLISWNTWGRARWRVVRVVPN